MTAHLPSLAEPLQIELRRVMQWLEGERETERAELQSLVTKRRYTRFVDDLNAFLTTPGARTVEPAADQVMPTLVRHVLPTVIYEHLGVVRAYERVVESADAPMLHQLRIEFKRLRYAIAFFEELLGSSVRAYLKELKAMQDHLGRMQDVATAHLLLEPMKPRLDQAQTEALDAYLAAIEAERADLRGQVADKWAKFDSALVQKKLTSAIAAF
jgi:CHAD domain-containing protein